MSPPRPGALPAGSRWTPPTMRLGWALQAVLVCLLVVGLYLFVSVGSAIGQGALLGMVAIGAPLALAVWRWPLVGLTGLVALGSVHPTAMLLIYHLSQSIVVVKSSQLWKEGLVLILLAKVIELAFRRRTAPMLYLLDLGIIIYITYGVLYLFYPSEVQGSDIMSALMGLRADMFFLLAYFIGRGAPVSLAQVRLLVKTFMAAAFIISVFAGLQFLAPGATNGLFEMISFRDYMEIQRGDQGVLYALRQNEIAGTLIPRASSLLLSDLALAFHMLLAVPIAGALFVVTSRLRERLMANVLLLATLGCTVLTVTRSAIFALLPLLATVLFRPRGLPAAALVALQVAVIALPVAARLQVTPDLLRDMFSPKEASVQGHLEALDVSLDIVQNQPFGRGLGTAGQVSQRFTPEDGVTNESWYFQIATEMGVPAALIWVLILAGVFVTALLRSTQVRDPWLKALCLGMAGATAGISVMSLTLHAWDGLTTAIIYWLFAGLVVRARDLDGAEKEVYRAHRRVA